jgi:predicted transcriptional regulator
MKTMPLRSQVLKDQKAIVLLHNPKYRDLIRYFMEQPSTIKTAAKDTGQTVQRTYNHVQRLLETGFLEIISQQPRTGKPLKFYAATATKSLGYTETIRAELQPLQNQMLKLFEAHLTSRNPLEWGTRLFKDPSGFTHLAFTPQENWQNMDFLLDLLHPDEPALMNYWAKIKLPKPQAKALQLELMQLWRKYYFAAHATADTTTLETFGIGFMLVPLPN